MTGHADDDFDLAETIAASEHDDDPETDERTGRAAAAQRIEQQRSWVDHQLRVAMERGDFDDLPGAGKPIRGLGENHDPDWWLKKLVERERISVLPASLQLRKDDAELDARLDGLAVEREVRREVEDFNARVIRARYTPVDNTPPLVTMPRDVEATVEAWRTRREQRAAEAAARLAADEAATPTPRHRPRLWPRRPRNRPRPRPRRPSP